MSYDTLALIHSIAAYVWFGALFGSLVFATLASRRSPDGILVGAYAMLRFSTRVGLPAAVILMVAGIWMMTEGGASWGATWISIGFLVWILAAVGGSGLMHPTARKLRNASIGTPQAAAYAKRIIWIGAAQIILVVIAIWAMSSQPG
ncbi:MAG: DUF2269 family protein [Gaiellales bacterium]|jgi:uncharacterized membrane protein